MNQLFVIQYLKEDEWIFCKNSSGHPSVFGEKSHAQDDLSQWMLGQHENHTYDRCATQYRMLEGYFVQQFVYSSTDE